MDIRPGSDMDQHRKECAQCERLAADIMSVSSRVRNMDRQTTPDGFDTRLNERIAALQASKLNQGVIARFIDSLALEMWMHSMKRRYAPIIALAALFAMIIGVGMPQIAHRMSQPMNDMDWSYIQTCKDAHSALVPNEPLTNESTVILKSQALIESQEL